MIRSSRFTPQHGAQTITVIDGQVIPSSVSSESILRTAQRLKSAKFLIWHNGEECIVNAKELRRILSPESFSTVLATAGNVAIVDNRLIAII